MQSAVHDATRELLAEVGRAELTVPMIAARAGVTSSTIYRRWGDLRQLLSDVAVERLRPETPPEDTGSLRTDLLRWAEQYLEESGSPTGKAYLLDVLAANADPSNQFQCSRFNQRQIGHIVDRAIARGEPAPEVDTVLDHVVAPTIYRILFGTELPPVEWVRGLVSSVLEGLTVKEVR
ncbi:transcriptional regulator, TetR family [Actinoalloteichus hymeniacidonis]|uniref:Transcriptional regulator, TetR family n=1 Tax=Actinoalloteichus hymeniacidonis TaxID=340345 RepID=A0AAC9HRA6_9PSEU|nr:transcriptional regulator, TetR family [Actinoalloteichus hymeniacidonis]